LSKDILTRKRLLTPHQVSEFLKVSLSTLRRWRNSAIEKIPFTKSNGKLIRYKTKDVESFKETLQKVQQPYVQRDFSEKAIRARLKSARIYDDGKWLEHNLNMEKNNGEQYN